MRSRQASGHEAFEARLAAPGDRSALSALLARAWRRHGDTSAEAQAALLAGRASAIALAGEEAIGFLGLSVRSPAGEPPQTWVDVDLIALDANMGSGRVLRALFDAVRAALRSLRGAGLVCLTSAEWLQQSLEATGFQHADRILTYVHTGGEQPDAAPRVAELSAAGAQDADTLLALNARAFAPLWQYDDATLIGWLLTADRAVLARIDGEPVGFALTAARPAGDLAHLIRVACDPRHQDRGVGRQLVVDAVRHAYCAGRQGLALNTQASNAISRHLYESLGFRPNGHELAVFTRPL